MSGSANAAQHHANVGTCDRWVARRCGSCFSDLWVALSTSRRTVVTRSVAGESRRRRAARVERLKLQPVARRRVTTAVPRVQEKLAGRPTAVARVVVRDGKPSAGGVSGGRAGAAAGGRRNGGTGGSAGAASVGTLKPPCAACAQASSACEDMTPAPGSSRAGAIAAKLGRSHFLIGMGNDLDNDHSKDGAYTLGATLDLHYAYMVGLPGHGRLARLEQRRNVRQHPHRQCSQQLRDADVHAVLDGSLGRRQSRQG